MPRSNALRVLAALQAELERSLKTLGTLDPPAYFIGYTVTDTQRVNVQAPMERF